MSINVLPDNRHLLPNWRNVHTTAQLGELNGMGEPHKVHFDISGLINDWVSDQNIGTAADLLNASFISDIKDDSRIAEAAEFVLRLGIDPSKPLFDIARNVKEGSIKKNNNEILRSNIVSVDDLRASFDIRKVYIKIHKLKIQLRNFPTNSILWVEISRLYSFIGQSIPAVKAMEIAIAIDPNNRFIVRSAARLFSHLGDYERALHVVRKSQSLKSDPWLLSAHVTISSILGKYQVLFKQSQEIVDSKSFSPFDKTELASSLGTVELDNGAVKKAGKNFNVSLQQPNDNTLAQFEWIAQNDPHFEFNPLTFSSVKNPFEAFARQHFEDGNWNESLEYCIKWYVDMPFAKIPVMLGTYIATALLDDYEAGLDFAKAGYIANPSDPIILNNLIYCLCSTSRMEQVELYLRQLDRLDLRSVTPEAYITLLATIGLYNFRIGQIAGGKQHYNKAIEVAEKTGNHALAVSAIVNFMRELMKVRDPETVSVVQKINSVDLKSLPKNVLKEYEKMRSNYEKYQSVDTGGL